MQFQQPSDDGRLNRVSNYTFVQWVSNYLRTEIRILIPASEKLRVSVLRRMRWPLAGWALPSVQEFGPHPHADGGNDHRKNAGNLHASTPLASQCERSWSAAARYPGNPASMTTWPYQTPATGPHIVACSQQFSNSFNSRRKHGIACFIPQICLMACMCLVL